MFERCARAAVPGASEETWARLAAMLQLLYSATAWDQLRSFRDTDADTAADIVGDAIRLLLAGARQQGARPTGRGRRASRTDAADSARSRTTNTKEA